MSFYILIKKKCFVKKYFFRFFYSISNHDYLKLQTIWLFNFNKILFMKL